MGAIRLPSGDLLIPAEAHGLGKVGPDHPDGGRGLPRAEDEADPQPGERERA